MKKIIFFLALIFIVFSIHAQEPDNFFPNSKMTKESGKLDKNGYPIGLWKYYSDDGYLDYTINWDLKYIKKYYTTGVLKEEGIFIPETGIHVGKWISYFKTGTIKKVALFDKKGKRIE